MSSTTEARDAPGAPGKPPGAAWDQIERWVGLLILAACVAFVFTELRPGLLFSDTTASGGDTGAHVWWPDFLADHLLPWRLSGWSPDFYAGFPAGQFYFPFPSLVIVALDLVMPYNVAFKLGTALGPLLLPVGGYVFGRGINAPPPVPAAFAVGATGFLFFAGEPGNSLSHNLDIMGGNLASTLAGEFSFTIALALALCFLGALAWSLRTQRALWLPAVLLALTVMSHIVVTAFAVIGAVVVWLGTRPQRNLPRSLAIGAVGALLTAVWTLPLLANLGLTTDMRYGAITEHAEYLFPSELWVPGGPWPWEWGAGVLGGIALVAGLAAAVISRRTSTLIVAGITIATGLVFHLWDGLLDSPVWNLRVLPFWYLMVFLVLALGAAEIVRGVGWLVGWLVDALAARRARGARDPVAGNRFGPVRVVTASTLVSILAIAALVDIAPDPPAPGEPLCSDGGVNATTAAALEPSLVICNNFLPSWVAYNYAGFEDTLGQETAGVRGQPKSFREYRGLIDAIDALPPGRVLWEGGSALGSYGTPLALMLLPYWTDGRHPSMEGVYYEASATTPYLFMAVATLSGPGNASNPVRGVPYRTFDDFALGVRYLQLMGTRYFVAHSTEAIQRADADPTLRRVATTDDRDGLAPQGWSIYRVPDAALVTPLRYQPVVVREPNEAGEAACRRRLVDKGVSALDLDELATWQDCIAVPWFDDRGALDRPLVDEGLASWQRTGAGGALELPKVELDDVEVSRIRAGDDFVSFRVSRPGVPVLVKTSYYPNWGVQGARGPYRATPNFMVVVPTGRDVRLEFGRTGVEWVGFLLTLLGLAGLVALVLVPRRRRAGTLPAGPALPPPESRAPGSNGPPMNPARS